MGEVPINTVAMIGKGLSVHGFPSGHSLDSGELSVGYVGLVTGERLIVDQRKRLSSPKSMASSAWWRSSRSGICERLLIG